MSKTLEMRGCRGPAEVWTQVSAGDCVGGCLWAHASSFLCSLLVLHTKEQRALRLLHTFKSSCVCACVTVGVCSRGCDSNFTPQLEKAEELDLQYNILQMVVLVREAGKILFWFQKERKKSHSVPTRISSEAFILIPEVFKNIFKTISAYTIAINRNAV